MKKVRNTLLKISAYIAVFTFVCGVCALDAPGQREYRIAVLISIISGVYLAFYYTANKERLSDMKPDNLR